ncbi:glycoside hydrolase family 97 catalytic domain-containing protein [Geofilum sp. OHC36d9]|uniref:glycoside hydrolase family 97 catalytic domain-containing protein n=1 Tax=Geofilum sp. OHC36d9 TaxID=3458413 RepID=UPI0040345C76
MKRKLLICYLFIITTLAVAQEQSICSPDGRLVLTIKTIAGSCCYTVKYDQNLMLEDSPLGLITNVGDFSKGLTLQSIERNSVEKEYNQDKIKQSHIVYEANELKVALTNKENKQFEVIFRVSNNDVGFKYSLPQYGETAACIVEKEITGFNLPQHTTTFLSPQATAGIGWKHTKPSYEEEYVADEVINTPSKYGQGYTFPSLFHVGDQGWILISETGVSSKYCASHLSDGTNDGIYSIAFPQVGENNGFGSATAVLSLPGSTPWRTITVGNNLKPIVETTIPFDLVEPLFEPSYEYQYGRSTWSWIMWQDRSMNYDDQIIYINLAAELGYEYILMDALWDTQVGYDRMPELFKYAQSKGVDVFLWYNSNGSWNDAPQGPKHRMDNVIVRKKEMKWLQEMGVKGLKVDFFGGDKQETMKLYEEILSDANDYGLMVIFHGCTLPRGWERMYPNYVGSEAVLASENLIFTQHANEMEAYNACLHPFIRNAVGSMEFGPVLLNKRHNRNNDGGTIRRTSDVFQLATSILYQSPVQMFAIAPNNLTDVPSFEIDFMKKVPTIWDETVFIDGYPGKYVVVARRHQDKWFVVGVNAENEALSIDVTLPMLAGKTIAYYGDNLDLTPFQKEQKIKKSGSVKLVIQPNGGVILTTNF